MELKTAGPAHLIVQQLMMAFAQQKTLEPAFARDLVSSSEALIALRVAAAAVDYNFQQGNLDAFSTETIMGGLVLAWERIRPLSEELSPAGSSIEAYLRQYLASMVEVRKQFGV